MLDENKKMRKELEEYQQQQLGVLEKELSSQAVRVGNASVVLKEVPPLDAKSMKDLVFRMTSAKPDMFVLLGSADKGKVQLHLGISKSLAESQKLDASKMIRELAKLVRGGGGGQTFYASAGGNDPSGLQEVFAQARQIVEEVTQQA
jgi:alanyl-tRNA synthetase